MSTVARRAARLVDNPELLRERLRDAPEGPGVYLMRDLEARVVYVGKAAVLRSRLRSYFSGVESHPDRTRRLVERIFDFEVVPCATEREALILENTFIKRYRPRFNVRLKDDKNYLYLKIPLPGAPDTHAPGTAREGARARRGGDAALRAAQFPRPYYSRRVQRDGARYFGPYTSAQSLRTTVRALRTIFPFRTCSDEIFRRGRVCLDYHIKRCTGPCEGRIDAPGYAELLQQVELFMDGRSSVLTRQLEQRMREAAERMDFENAARQRDRLRAIDRLRERQKTIGGARSAQDCLGIAISGGQGMVAVLAVRDGRVSGMETHALEGVAGLAESDALAAFIAQYYGDSTSVPRVILVGEDLPDAVVLREFLTEQRGANVELRVPRRGTSRALVEQARDTALTALRQARIEADFDAERTGALLADLQVRLDLPEPPQRIECYDISNTMGTNSVGSMVVFEDGRPRPAHYRHFAIRSVVGANDFASMQETLRRRFGRYRLATAEDDVPVDDPAGSNGGSSVGGSPGDGDLLAVADGDGEAQGETATTVAEENGGRARRPSRRRGAAPSALADESFATLPDLVLVDGGKGQLAAAREVMRDLGLASVPLAGLAKRNEELFVPGRSQPVLLPQDSPTLFLVQRVRDEAHRFAITRHRAKRGREALRSRLDVVPGLGPARRRALLRRFGSIDRVREASVEELVEVVPRTVALRIRELL